MILVDGKLADAVPADDRGLAYGDGVFETMLVRRGQLPLLEMHFDRLEKGLRVLGIGTIPREVLAADVMEAARAFPGGVVKLVVTRGSGGRGYRPTTSAPRRIVQGSDAPAHVTEWQRDGIGVRICETRLEGPRRLAGIKHLNRLAQVMARAEWQDEFEEGLMRDVDGHLVEGTMSNLFVVHEGVLVAPPVGAGVRGVMRERVLALARDLQVPVRETNLGDDQVEQADEVFLTNSVMRVVPVVRLGNRTRRIGTMTRQLQAAVERELDERACFEN